MPRVRRPPVVAPTARGSRHGATLNPERVHELERVAPRVRTGTRVEARSDGPGPGAEFIVRLPVLRVEAPIASNSPSTADLETRTRGRVLIVDDNVDSAEALAQLLELSGHTVRVVHDGRTAADAARDSRPHVIRLDIGLPGLNGFDFVRQFRSSPDLASLRIVATTGYGRDEDRHRSFEAGFDHHLTKPVAAGEIEAIRAEEWPRAQGSPAAARTIQ